MILVSIPDHCLLFYVATQISLTKFDVGRSLMYIRGLIPRNFTELSEAVRLLHSCYFDTDDNGF